MIRIIGDIILDAWIKGEQSIKSPEANVKIFSYKNTPDYNLGGAANVAANIKSLKNNVKLYGTIGRDSDGIILHNLLKKKKIKSTINFTKNITTTKTRFIDNKKRHILRVDKENKNNFDIKNLKKEIKKEDIIIISDYDKGVIKKNTINKILAYNKNLFIDPKNKAEYYKGAFLVKPNMKQFKKWVGSFSIKKSINLINRMKWHWLIVTDSANGVYVINKSGEFDHYKYKTKKVLDITGAGDTFISTLCHYFNLGMDVFQSCDLACYASTLSTEKSKTYVLEKKDIYKNKIFTNGVFDILHKGHIELLKYCNILGKKLIIGLNSNASVKINKGENRPYNNFKVRKKNLLKYNFVDQVIEFNTKTPLNLIKKIKPDIIVKGGDYKKSNVVGNKIAQIRIFKTISGLSSTNLINKK